LLYKSILGTTKIKLNIQIPCYKEEKTMPQTVKTFRGIPMEIIGVEKIDLLITQLSGMCSLKIFDDINNFRSQISGLQNRNTSNG